MTAHFCPACGGNLELRPAAERPRLACAGCGVTHYPQPSITVGVLIETDDKVLLIQRGTPPFQNQWCLPSGFLENDEEPGEAALRELQEETGLEGVIERVEGVYKSVADPRGAQVFIVYRCRITGGKAKVTEEALAVESFGVDELPTLAPGASLEAIKAWISLKQQVAVD